MAQVEIAIGHIKIGIGDDDEDCADVVALAKSLLFEVIERVEVSGEDDDEEDEDE